ncbi:hypothetical protein ScPMuIL_006707 [Solemya velum]
MTKGINVFQKRNLWAYIEYETICPSPPPMFLQRAKVFSLLPKEVITVTEHSGTMNGVTMVTQVHTVGHTPTPTVAGCGSPRSTYSLLKLNTAMSSETSDLEDSEKSAEVAPIPYSRYGTTGIQGYRLPRYDIKDDYCSQKYVNAK